MSLISLFLTWPLHLLFPCPTEPSGTPAEYATSVYRKLQHVFKFRQENQEHAHEQQKSQYDKKAKYTSYNVGDLVWLNDPAHFRCKLAPCWKGPYTIKQNVQPTDGYSVLYAIQPKGFPESHHKWYIITVLNLTCLPPISLDKQFRIHHLPLHSLLEGKYPLVLIIPLHLLSKRTCLLLYW